MTVKIILEIRISQNSADQRSSTIAVRLAEIGGRLSGWRPALESGPARAYFTFNSEDERERFLSRALNTPGVSLSDVA